ncbi:MAG: CHRD domain-containing protein [Burkholderiaceae bacterium]
MRHVAIGVVLGLAVAATASAHDGRELKAELRGVNEVPAVETETRGRFEIQESRDGKSAEYTLKVSDGQRLTQAHLHCGQEGVNGPVIVFLAGLHEPGWDVDGKWISNATVTDRNVVNAACGATLSEVLEQARVGNVYVNVHSDDHRAGVIRGQLLEPRKDRH